MLFVVKSSISIKEKFRVWNIEIEDFEIVDKFQLID